MAFQGHAREGFATSADYGWCHTLPPESSKAKIQICDNTKQPMRRDFISDPFYSKRTKALLRTLGLKIPSENEIIRGRADEILFLNSHGLVIKIGKNPLYELINPAILQPLTWVSDGILNASIFPGIQHLEYNSAQHENKTEFYEGGSSETSVVIGFLIDSYQKANDVINQNIGTIPIENRPFVTNMPLLLDADKINNGDIEEERAIEKASLIKNSVLKNRHKVVFDIMEYLYKDIPRYNFFMKAFIAHQPLRDQFNHALGQTAESQRLKLLKDVYQRCRDCVAGNDPEVALYSPWTGKPEDNLLKSQPNPHPA